MDYPPHVSKSLTLLLTTLVLPRRLGERSANGEFVNSAQIGGIDRRFQQTSETRVARVPKKFDHGGVGGINLTELLVNERLLFGRNP